MRRERAPALYFLTYPTEVFLSDFPPKLVTGTAGERLHRAHWPCVCVCVCVCVCCEANRPVGLTRDEMPLLVRSCDTFRKTQPKLRRLCATFFQGGDLCVSFL